MIPSLYFDVSTFSLWYDNNIISQGFEDQEFATGLIWAFLVSPDQSPPDDILLLSPADRIRYIYIESLINHEKRHFLDSIVTNYGAAQFRRFYRIYINAAEILGNRIKAKEPLVVPVAAYLDEVRLKFIEHRSGRRIDTDKLGDLSRLFKEIVNTELIHHIDNGPADSPSGETMEVGGNAQLEALGYIYQNSSVVHRYGQNIAIAVHDHAPELSTKYRWVESLNFLKNAMVKDVTGEVTIVDGTVLVCILYAALMCRYWKDETLTEEEEYLHFPSLRLNLLANAVHALKLKPGQYSMREAWALVNGLCKELFGLTATEEAWRDWRYSKTFLEKALASNPNLFPPVRSAFEDYLQLRERLLRTLEESPEELLDMRTYHHMTESRLRPLPIISIAQGDIIDEDPQIKPLFAQPLNNGRQMVWGATSISNDSRLIQLDYNKGWNEIITLLAPMAKLCIGGYNYQTMLPREFTSVESMLERQGVRLIVDYGFDGPDEQNEIEAFWKMSQKKTAICDICNAPIRTGEGNYYSPWFFRKSKTRFEWIVNNWGGGDQGLFLAKKDWSPWIVCENCHVELQKI